MFNKIDKLLLDKISTLKKTSDNSVDAIVYSNDYENTKLVLQSKLDSDYIIELPFISCFAIKTNYDKLYELAYTNSINYIASDTKVCSLIYNSKKFIKIDNLYKKITKKANHSCVIIDTGVYPHIDFCLGKNRIVKFVDLINNQLDCYDDNGHGTFVAGVFGANSVTDKYSGIDNDCELIVIKALDKDGETTSVKILEAMQWVLNNKDNFNIKVVCMSFGSMVKDRADPLVYGAEVLWNNGIVVVAAGGNSGPEIQTIMSPGASRKVITVGSLDNIFEELKVADFSSRGPVFNYYKPDILLPGVDIISNNVFGNDKRFYAKMSGTSVSTPMVAGVVSLLYKINPNYTPDQIKYMLVNSCVQITGDRNSEGYGWLDLSKLVLI